MYAALIPIETAAVMPAGITFLLLLYRPAMMTDRNTLIARHTAMLPRADVSSILRPDSARMRAAPRADVRDLRLPALTYANTPPAVMWVVEREQEDKGGGRRCRK